MKRSKLIVEIPHNLSRKDRLAMEQWRMLLNELLSSEQPCAPSEKKKRKKKKTIKRRRTGDAK